MKHFEMANADDTEELVKAVQLAFVGMLKDIIAGVKSDAGDNVPGLTWEQLEYIIDAIGKKEPIIIKQEHEL